LRCYQGGRHGGLLAKRSQVIRHAEHFMANIFKNWKLSWQTQREQAALRRRAIPDDLWKRTLVRYPFLQRHQPSDAAELRRLTSLFLDRKEFNTAGGLRLTDAMAVAVAAQAVLPILRLGLHRYDSFVGIVLHPDQVVARRETADDDGVVHVYDEPLAGEAMLGGPLMLSWRDVRSAGPHLAQPDQGPAYNVVIHEFAHVLDLSNRVGDDNAPALPALPPDLPAAEWRQTLLTEFKRFVAQVEATEGATAPSSQGVLDPYGAQSQAEFFAVASEAFFVSPAALQKHCAKLYGLFVRFYKQDPATDTPKARQRRS
jgi:MtfA peptidase